MAVQLTLTDISSGYQGSDIQANFTAIEDEFDKVLYRDGSRTMTDALDMNAQRILNLPIPVSDFEPARKRELGTYLDDAETAQTAAEDAQAAAEAAQAAAEAASSSTFTDEEIDLGGDFDAGSTVRCHKQGHQVTIQSLDNYDHDVSISASSASGDIPEAMRPDVSYKKTLWTATGVVTISVDTLGRVNVLHFNYDGTTRSGATAPVFSINYLV